jgi:transposase
LSKKRLEMRRIRECLRLYFESGLSIEKTALACRISKGAAFKQIKKFKDSELKWPEAKGFSDKQLQEILYVKKSARQTPIGIDWAHIAREMIRPHVTLMLLYDEYRKENPTGIGRSTFYEHFKIFLKESKNADMKIIHKGGDKLFVDYSGDGLEYIDLDTGEVIPVDLFCSSWGASSYCHAYVTLGQKSEDWALSCVKSFEYFGCVPNVLVPDNPKATVIKANKYDPILNGMYRKMAEHYDTVVLPARVRKPKDKAVVESNVLHIQRHILGRLRNRQFFSLHEIKDAVGEELDSFNQKPMQGYGGLNRQERFLDLDKPYANALPEKPFEITSLKEGARVAPNYHIEYDKHFYSVPHHIIGKKVDVYQMGNILEIYHDSIHVCRHRKGRSDYGYTTIEEHMPENHRYVKGWSVSYFVSKAGEIGENTSNLVKSLMERLKHPEQGYRSARGVLSFQKKYTAQRLESACKRALHYKCPTYKSVKSILEKGLDKKELQGSQENTKPVTHHENVRGSSYYN